jgi:hypothetical protein
MGVRVEDGVDDMMIMGDCRKNFERDFFGAVLMDGVKML